jgi:hypothetical protein
MRAEAVGVVCRCEDPTRLAALWLATLPLKGEG